VYKTVQKALQKAGVETTLEVVLEYGAGKEKFQAINDVLESTGHKNNSKINASEIFESFKEMLVEAYEKLEVTPCEGVEELFLKLKENGVKVVLNTGYNRETAQTLLNKLGWKVGNQIDALITADDVVNGRPTSEMIDKAMQLFNITDAAHVLKAGDSIIDIEEGQNANCGVTVGVLTGAHTREQLETARPTMILDSLQELGAVLFPNTAK
jgi:phosphonatase-like hydrolase